MFSRAQEQLEAVFESVRDGICVQDREFRWVYANEAAARMCGFSSVKDFLEASVEDTIQRFEILDASGRPFDLHRLPARRIFEGDPGPVNETMRVRDRRTGVESWTSSTAYPIPGEDGRARYVVSVFRDVTAERTRERTQWLQARVLESMREGVTLADENGQIVYSNPAETAMFGASLIGRHLSTQIAGTPVDARTEVERVLAEVKTHGKWTGEWRHRRADGGEFFTRTQATPLWIGEKLHFLTVSEDLTEEKRIREAVQETDRRFRTLAETMPQLVWTVSATGDNEYVNENCLLYTGVPMEDQGVGHWTKALHPEDAERAYNAWMEATTSGRNFECEYRLRRFDGVYRWFLGRAAPIRSTNGRITGWVGTATDIQEQKEAEEDQRFLAEATGVLGSSLEFKSRMQAAADLTVRRFQGWCTIYLLREGELVAEAFAHTDPERVARTREFGDRVRLTDGTLTMKAATTGQSQLVTEITEKELQAAAKSEEHLEFLRTLPLRSAIITPLKRDGRVEGVMTIVSETQTLASKDVLVAEELARHLVLAMDNAKLYGAARDAIRARDDLLSVTSHELKTPLTTLKLQLQLAQRLVANTSDEDGKLASTIKSSVRQVDRLTNLIESLLDFSRQSDGRMPFQLEECDFSRLVSEAVERLDEQIRASRSDFSANVKPGLSVHGDPLRLDQVVVNLLTNAIKYGERNPIELTLEADDSRLFLEVRDYGMGIAPELQERIFDRFERGVSHRNISGFGLGLFISKQIVEAHGGRIGVRSSPGAGSAFLVELPRLP